MSETRTCRTAEDAFRAGWDDGADDAPLTPEQQRRVLALVRPYRDDLTARAEAA